MHAALTVAWQVTMYAGTRRREAHQDVQQLMDEHCEIVLEVVDNDVAVQDLPHDGAAGHIVLEQGSSAGQQGAARAAEEITIWFEQDHEVRVVACTIILCKPTMACAHVTGPCRTFSTPRYTLAGQARNGLVGEPEGRSRRHSSVSAFTSAQWICISKWHI